MLLMKYLNWERCTYEDYLEVCEQFGYNNESSPFYMKFAIERGVKLDFYLHVLHGEVVGGVSIDNGWVCNDYKNPRSQTKEFPVPRDSIYLPFKPGVKYILPFKSKSLSVLNVGIKNASFNLLSKRRAATLKMSAEFSGKTRSSRNRDVKRFIASGGHFENVSKFGWQELYDMYSTLYRCRRPGAEVNGVTDKDFFRTFKDNLLGDVAFLNENPVSFQLNLISSSVAGCFVDFINIGYDTSIQSHSLGTLCMWRNLLLAEEFSGKQNLQLHYSFGKMSGEYKNRWCRPTPVGRALWL